MTRAAYRVDPFIRPPPFPYWKKELRPVQTLLEPTSYRFHENSKLIVVEGLPAVGKSKLAEQLAEQFGLLYMPAPTHDEIYINTYGYDLRKLDPQLPKTIQSFDLRNFMSAPKDLRTAWFQICYMYMRCDQYMNALRHILNTGQGVVLDRCVHSDAVFMDAMVKAGYVREVVHKWYKHMHHRSCRRLFRPHLLIYLDVPVDSVKDKIKKRGISYEVNSNVLSSEYLGDLENNYKDKYLREMAPYCELLIYDWTNGGDISAVVDDIEELDLDTYDKHGKFFQWILNDVDTVNSYRMMFHEKWEIYKETAALLDVNIPRELLETAEEELAWEAAVKEVPSEKYNYGYNPEMGDKVLWDRGPIQSDAGLRKTPRDLIHLGKALKFIK